MQFKESHWFLYRNNMSQDSQNTSKGPITLEKALQAYRVLAAPARLSYYYGLANNAREALETINPGSNNAMDLRRADPHIWKNLSGHIYHNGHITIAPGIKVPVGQKFNQCYLTDLVDIITDPNNAKIAKENRKALFSTLDGTRASGNDAFEKWNGFQVIDMDIKDATIAKELKAHIFKTLCKCNWFFGVTLSASGKGLHVYTKIKIPEDTGEGLAKKKLIYLTNFRHKFSFVYIACLSAMETIGFTKAQLTKWMDLSMFRPAQGAFIGYDPDVMININFFEDFIYFSFDNVEDIGHPEIDWITYPELKEAFARWEWFEESDDTITATLLNDKSEAGPDGKPHDKIHYKHNERWRIANTLVNIFATRDENGNITNVAIPIKYMRAVVSNKVPDKEIIADCQTAGRHGKPIDTWAVNRLNTMHGFNIKIKSDNPDVGADKLLDMMAGINNPNQIRPSDHYYRFDITKDQYLSDILVPIIDHLGRITLIEAGPGLGKTEMVKRLVAQGKKVMMILPFTSIIKSKVEEQEGWYYAYGSRKPKLDVEHGLALTIDKFSRIPLAEIRAAGFDYIFLDESHLLFMSEYRPVMPKVIGMIRNTQVPIVMMSGTPTGELVFFPDIVHLHVVKEEVRKKEVQINLVDSTSTLFYHMCKAMARDIANGKRILFPSNEGTTYSKRVQAGIQYFLSIDHGITDPLNLKYYKKSNVGDDFMDQVNFNKTIEDTQVVMCTTYMGCGVDIEDRYEFQIYFGDICTAAECDQWCNRLRNNDLFVKVYVAKNDAEGNSREIHRFRPMNFQLDDEEIKTVHSILRMCNAMVERNPVEYKYNSVVQSIISDNRYIVYDEIQCKYYIDEIAFKTVTFERKYRDYAQQLPVFMKGMECYGYNISVVDLGAFSVTGPEIFRDVKNVVKLASDEQAALNTVHIEELLDLFTDTRMEIYKEVMSGLYEIRKGNEWHEDEDKKIMTVKNVEVFEKVVPIFLSMSKRFDIPVIKDIFEYCKTNNHYNFAAIGRIRTLINLVESDEARNLDLPIKEFMDDAWHYADRKKTDKKEFEDWITRHVNEYARRESDATIQIMLAEGAIKRLTNVLTRLFKCLVRCTRPNKQGEFEMERIELLWEKRKLFSDAQNTNITVLDDFLEACAHVHMQEVDIVTKKMDRKGNETEVVTKAYEPVSVRPLQAKPKKDREIKPRLLNEDGTRTIDSMDDSEMLMWSEGIID